MKVLFHVKHAQGPRSLADVASELGVPLTPLQVAALDVYASLLLERAVPAGMIAAADAERVRERHILDCLRAAAVVELGDRDAYDLGSGAGVPGLVVAIARPDLRVTLVETRRRRAAFLELAVERLALDNASVAAVRIEALTEPVDLCLARALAPLPRAWTLAEPLLRPRGRLVYFAGAESTTHRELAGLSILTVDSPVLERTGPLVIMAR